MGNFLCSSSLSAFGHQNKLSLSILRDFESFIPVFLGKKYHCCPPHENSGESFKSLTEFD
jgi:hypothetical protein